MKPVDFVTINELKPIYKQSVEANSIQVARIKDSEGTECQFNIIVGKGYYNIGDRVVYIQPDYCIPPTELFKEYYAPKTAEAPEGDPKKSKLGKKGRIRAVKFNFSFAGESDVIYSNGILINIEDFNKFVAKNNLDLEDLQKALQIVKYVADDSADGSKSGLAKGEIPYFLYKTDEDRIELKKDIVDRCFEEGEVLSFTTKRDGSSCTIYFKLENSEEQTGICSREMEKKLDQHFISAYKDGEFELHRYLNKELNVRGWYNDFTQKFYTNEEAAASFEKIMTEARDSFVETVKEHDYLTKLVAFCKTHELQLALRGELIGCGNKGSGNKLNLDAKLPKSKIIWFGVDDLEPGFAQRINYKDEYNLKAVCEALEFEYTQEIFEGVYSYDEIIKKANDYFKYIESTGQVIEGIVIRTKFSNKLSTKYLNPKYDANS